MKKRSLISVLLALAVLITLLPTAALAEDGGLANFQKKNTYEEGRFSDVPAGAWYAENVRAAYELGLIEGKSDSAFEPAGNVTLAEAVVLACRLHSIYHTGAAEFAQSSPWYQVYADYAAANGVISAEGFSDYTAEATRAQFAAILAAALPESALAPINTVEDGAIPDVPDSAPFAAAVYRLYRAGILTGGDGRGAFTPDSHIKRSEAAALATRMADASLRQSVELRKTESSFAVHFIDVGQGDAALVLCDGEAMLIDGGDASASGVVYSYLKKQSVTRLRYIVCTHAHEDHVGGLSGALNYASADVALAPVTDDESKAFESFKAHLAKQGKTITLPKAGDTFPLGSAVVAVLGPVSPAETPNNGSLVLRVTYGETSFLFTGDAEREEEQDILAADYALKSTVLKVGHHGGDASTSYPFLWAVMPEAAVISVGGGNPYGHPEPGLLSRLRDADAAVYRTDMQGDIICASDGSEVTFTVSRNSDADTLSPAAEPSPVPTYPPQTGGGYILNTNTMKFHLPDCSSAARISPANRSTYAGTREELIAMGYSPCGNCKP